MKFACDRCHKQFSTTDEPVAGRVYRIPCKCGNTIVVQLGAAALPVPPARCAAPRPRRSSPPPIPTPRPAAAQPAGPPAVAAACSAAADAIIDDPFLRAQRRDGPDLRVLLACASEDVTPTVLGAPLAIRDPDAPRELSSVYEPEPPLDPFEVEIRRTRTHALALGGATGGAIGAFFAAVMTIVLLRPWSQAAAGTPEPALEFPAAQLSSHRFDRQLAARKPPIVRAATTAAVATARPRSPEPAAPPSPSPSDPPAAEPGDAAIAPVAATAAAPPAPVEEPAARAEEPDARPVEADAPEERAAATADGPPRAEEASSEAPPAIEPAAAERVEREPIAVGVAAGSPTREP